MTEGGISTKAMPIQDYMKLQTDYKQGAETQTYIFTCNAIFPSYGNVYSRLNNSKA